MKRVLVVLTVAACSALLVAGAHAYPGPNSIGLYTVADATGPVSTNIDWEGSGYTAFSLCLCLTNLEVPGLSAFECEVVVETPGGVLAFNSWVLNGGINASDTAAGKFFAAFSPAAQANAQGVYHVASYNGALTGADGVSFYIKAYEVPSIPGSVYPVFINGDNPGDLRIAFQSGGGPDLPVFTFNGGIVPPGPVVPNEDTTWGNLKTLFR